MVLIVKKDYRTLFLKEFIRELVRNSAGNKPILLSYHPVREEIYDKPAVEVKTKEIDEERFKPQPRQINPNLQLPQKFIPASLNLPKTEIVSPMPVPMQGQLNLGKLNALLGDSRITSIECLGPGKIILVRSMGKTSQTQIILNEEEIKNITENFAKAAKVPILGGVFKAAVGSLVITAVISDFVGSRFIINKYTPYSILEQVPRNLPVR